MDVVLAILLLVWVLVFLSSLAIVGIDWFSPRRLVFAFRTQLW